MDAFAITHDELDLQVRLPDRGGASQVPTARLEAHRPDAPEPADPAAIVPELWGVSPAGRLPSHPTDGDFKAILTDLKRFGLALARRRSAGRPRLRRAYRPHSGNLFRAQRGTRQRGAEEAMRVLTGDALH